MQFNLRIIYKLSIIASFNIVTGRIWRPDEVAAKFYLQCSEPQARAYIYLLEIIMSRVCH